jgi:transcriptional regulator with XRE-family HTH domain
MKIPGLRALRQARGLSQDALATHAGVHRTTVIRLEEGQEGQARTITKLLAALGIPRRQLTRDWFPPEPAAPGTRLCISCRRRFALRYRKQIYCSPTCRHRAYRARKALGGEAVSWKTRPCAQCQRWIGRKHRHAIYCSSPCRQQAYRERKALGQARGEEPAQAASEQRGASMPSLGMPNRSMPSPKVTDYARVVLQHLAQGGRLTYLDGLGARLWLPGPERRRVRRAAFHRLKQQGLIAQVEQIGEVHIYEISEAGRFVARGARPE